MPKMILTKAEPGMEPASPKPTYYSNLQNVLQEKMPDKPVHPDYVRNLMKQYQIHPEEQEWSGIHGFLNSQPGKVEKGPLLQHVSANLPIVHETRYGYDPHYSPYSGRVSGPIKYGKYTSKGNQDNSEILMGTPVANPQDLLANYTSGHWPVKNVVAHVRLGTSQDAEGNPATHIDEIQSDWHQEGRNAGYRKPFVPKLPPEKADALRSELTDKIMALHRKVYAYSNGDNKKFKEDHSNLVARELINNPGAFFSYFPQADLGRSGIPDGDVDHIKSLLEEAGDDLKDPAYRKQSGVADAPFKTNWEKIAFKRALREAIDRGHDRVTWSTGAQQADRYNLGNWFKRLEYDPERRELLAHRKSGGGAPLGFFLSPDELAGHIGHETAQQLLAQPLQKDGDTEFHRPLHRLDLSAAKHIGGEGMKGFYDHIIPSYAKELAKRYGGEVGQTKRVIGNGAASRRAMLARNKHDSDVVRQAAASPGWPQRADTWTPDDDAADRERVAFMAHHGIGVSRSDLRPDEMATDPEDWVRRVRKFVPDAYPDKIMNIKPVKRTESTHYMTISPRLRESLLNEGIPLWGERNVLAKCILLFAFQVGLRLAKAGRSELRRAC